MSADTSILPSELMVTPLPFVGFAGMDVQKNPVHKMIWDSFSANKKHDRLQVQYKLLPPNYEFPVSKPKRQSYEWYHPKGILKKNWLLKHQHVLPSVVALFQEMDWNDMQWSEHQLRCAAAVQALKGSLQGQSTKIVIVLLQRATQPMPGEEQLAGERTAALASACDINPKLIFLFPYNEHLQGYTYRLEASFLELASSYYTQMAKQIRSHRDQLTDAAHLTLKIRHQFKLGVIAEIRVDHSAALKCYTHCYDMLCEIRVVDTNCYEVKTIAGFLNYKICRLMFRSMPRDAVLQFKQHIERFRTRTGFREIRFEHFAWLSLQYSAFAELFCDAIKQGLPALQTEHPGIYYHKAADHMSRRKQLFAECNAQPAPVAGDSTYANQFYSEFFGVRSTKLGDASAEQQLFALAQANERHFNHSVAIIQLLGQAMAQYKIYRCLRFRKKLAVDMAEEYLQAGDHSKALTLYSLMLSDYRSDKWYGIFTHVLLKTLQAARLSGAIVDFLTCSLEAMSPRIAIARDRRLAIMDNFWRVLQHSPPVAEPGDPPVPSHIWSNALQKIQPPQPGLIAPIVIVDLDQLTELFECTLTFRSDQLRPGQPLHLDLYIRTRSELSVKLTQIEAVLCDSKLQFTMPAKRGLPVPERRQLTAIDDADPLWAPLAESTLLQPNVCYKFSFAEPDYRFPENEELHIRCLQLTITMGTHRVLLTQSTTLNRTAVFRPLDPAGQSMHSIAVHRVCYVQPTFHLATVTQHALAEPMLTNEYFRSELQLRNTAAGHALQAVAVSVSVPPALKASVFLCSDLGKSTQRLQSSLHFELGDLAAGGTSAVSYYVVSLVEANVELRQRLSYELPASDAHETAAGRSLTSGLLAVSESPVHRAGNAAAPGAGPSQRNHSMNIEPLTGGGVRKQRDDVLAVRCVAELALSARYFTLSKQPMRQAYCNEDVLLRVDLTVRSPCPIDILEMFLVSDQNVTENTQHQKTQRHQFAGGCASGHKVRDVKMLRAHSNSAQWLRSMPGPAAKPPTAINWLERRGSNARLTLAAPKTAPAVSGSNAPPSAVDKYKSNLLAKLPANSTIIGSSSSAVMSSNLMASRSDAGHLSPMAVEQSGRSADGSPAPAELPADAALAGRSSSLVRHVYNRAIDAFALTDHLRGFMRDRTLSDAGQWPVWGVYCVRWRRTDAPANAPDNESKFLIQGIEVIDPPLNIYCSLDDRMYVKVPMTLTVSIRNPTRYAIHLRTCLKNSDKFIFSGNTQLNVSVFAQSSFELSFNLYPMRAGWQSLPEFEVKYNTQYDEPKADADANVVAVNQELLQLVQRWMPKKVFVLPMQKQCPA